MKKNKHLKMKLAFLLMLAVMPFSISSLPIDLTDFESIEVDMGSARIQSIEVLGHEAKATKLPNDKAAKIIRDKVYSILKKEMPKRSPEYVREFTRTVLLASRHAKLDPLLLLSFIKTESHFNEKVIGNHGEIGLMQIRPETAEWISRHAGMVWMGKDALKDPHYNVRIGVEFIRYLRDRFGKDGSGYISAYNMGVRKVRELYQKNIKPSAYSTRIIENYRSFRSALL